MGVRASLFNSALQGQRDASATHLLLRGKATAGKLPALVDVMRDLLLHAQLDNQPRFEQLANEALARAESGVVSAGHSICAQRLAAQDSVAGWVSEQTGGVARLEHLRQLVRAVKDDWPV